MNGVIGKLNKRVVAVSDKLARYQAKTEQCVQNIMFLTNQSILLERLEKENRSYDLRPRNQKVVNFWSGKWDLPVR